MFHAVALVMTTLTGLQNVNYENRIERVFQPIAECDSLVGNALEVCISSVRRKGLEQCRLYLKETGRKEGVAGGRHRYDCLVISLD